MKDSLDRLACAGLKGLAVLLRALPRETALSAGRLMGRMVFPFSKRRYVGYADLKAALGSAYSEKERWAVLREQYEQFGMMLVEVLRFPKLSPDQVQRIYSIDHPEKITGAYALDKGGIFLSAHFGNWEMSQIIARLFGKPFHVLANSQKFPRLNQFLNECRESLGTVVVQRGMGIRDLLRSLRQKKWIALLGDQDAGKTEGLILPFFGRKTTVPSGPFELAARTGAAIIPAFTVRQGRKSAIHQTCVSGPFFCSEEDPASVETIARKYISDLEEVIRKYPSQWLWESKRWKYSWTKRLLILSDGKPGHVKQSQALAAKFREVTSQYGREGMEYPTQTVEVRFASNFHKRIFPVAAFLFLPFIAGNLRMIEFFFSPECRQAIREASADFVISAGASLLGLNLCLARDSRAKSIILMKPAFPFRIKNFDLAVIPMHDGREMPAEVFQTLLTLSPTDLEQSEKDAAKLKPLLKSPEKIRFAFFIGGPTRSFELPKAGIEKALQILEKISQTAGDYMITTSRRTPPEISSALKKHKENASGCQMLVIAAEDARPEVAGGMMHLAETLIVTEDSISMISEGVRLGKKVIVLGFDKPGLPEKHKRFHQILSRESAVSMANPETLEEKIHEQKPIQARHLMEKESDSLRKRLQEIL